MLYYLKQKAIAINLVVMTCNWLTVSFCYYLITYEMKYLPGNIFFNSYASCTAEFLSTIFYGVVLQYLGLKWGLIATNCLACTGTLLMIVWGWHAPGEWVLPILILFVKIGLNGMFFCLYLGNNMVFPTLFAVTAMGISNAIAKVATIGAPLLAEVPGTTSLWMIVGLTFTSQIACLFLRDSTESKSH